ncbi:MULTISPECIES: PfkB family carbohydrate kinase [Lacticaseibacillus]|uniref:pyridoxal kinase n=2 Tax=Lacticaseibacillus TaxID=2759736 RepID=A0AAN1C6K6_LACCA|nr:MULTISPECIES: PfkB family carbohydrate kinase [Lacticaseibacillus]ARY90697.1 pyridoxal kinase [Lacticaseibacillus casei]KAB1970553.1 pyridoxal kinase [Lacticaseibacillus casei]WLV81312.1 PfkB family carbohydrate kinase [Lacticaseibacillus sp. NCIMB 15473]WNX25272.1 PfkB family carbohydrate kinase [Lacticaseibacillus casei]WNX28043.1 PfkB family carbohydrate kinase [Lacticaseibacillus casei]
MNTKSLIISQDLCGVGQVSMGVALPLAAGLGLTPYVLPTALLSSHTGGLGANTYLDLSSEMPGILTHWQQLQLQPDGIYLGYLGQNAALQWKRWMPKFSAPLVLIDPVMADDGKLYKGFDAAYVETLQQLAYRATVLTPNVTEAQLLLDEPLVALTEPSAVMALAKRLHAQFHNAVLITGVPFHKQIAVVGIDASGETLALAQPKEPGHYFGTGDLFAAALATGLLKGQRLRQATATAMVAARLAIKATLAADADPKYGLNLAGVIPALSKQLP